MRGALAALSAGGDVQVRLWDGGPVQLARLRAPEALIVAGHGCESEPGIGDGTGQRLTPGGLRCPARTPLYLLACSQGREDLRAAWARGTGHPASRVRGAEGETETLLSTLFVLHLARDGPCRKKCACSAGLDLLFDQWVLANRIIRPFFAPSRELYRRTGGDPLAVLAYLERATDLGPVRGFLALAGSRVEYLTGLLPAQNKKGPFRGERPS